jgi:hypothetical protein
VTSATGDVTRPSQWHCQANWDQSVFDPQNPKAELRSRDERAPLDRDEIYAFEDWWKRIEALIAEADTVVFVLSPDSIASKVALKEVAFAASLNKRFAPIVCRLVDDGAVPDVLEKHNFLSFDDEAKFGVNVDHLAEALGTDIGWIRRHTEYGEAARRWSAENRPNGSLLRSPALEDAERWIAGRPQDAPAPTEEMRIFIHQSRAASTRRRNILTGSLGAGLVFALGLAGYALYQRSQVQRELDRANQALADSINNDLGIEHNKPMSARQRNALWRLALADEAVKRDFVSTLASSGDELSRAAPGFAHISRAIGPGLVVFQAATLVPVLIRTPGANAELRVAELGILAPNLDDGQVIGIVESNIGEPAKPETISADGVVALAANLTPAQARQALPPLAQRIRETSDADTLKVLANAIEVLAPKLISDQAGEAMDPILTRLNQTTDEDARQALSQALAALPAAFAPSQARDALKIATAQPSSLAVLAALAPKLVEALGDDALETMTPIFADAPSGHRLVQSFPSLPSKLIEALTELLLRQLERPDFSVADELQSLPVKLTEAQGQRALDAMLGAMDRSPPNAIHALGTIAGKLTPAQAEQAVDAALRRIDRAPDDFLVVQIARMIEPAAAKLTDAQRQHAFDLLLEVLGRRSDPRELEVLTVALGALARGFGDAQAHSAGELILQQMNDAQPASLPALGRVLRATRAKLTEGQARQALDPILKRLEPGARRHLREPAQKLGALAGALPEAQAQQAFEAAVRSLGLSPYHEVVEPGAFEELAKAVGSLTETLGQANAENALHLVLQEAGKCPSELFTLVGLVPAILAKPTAAETQPVLDCVLRRKPFGDALQTLGPLLSDTQANQAFEAVQQTISDENEPEKLRSQAIALETLAQKLADTHVKEAVALAISSLAWSAADDEAAAWARAVVALSKRSGGINEALAAAIAYPTSAGDAADVLLEEMRARHPDAPRKEAGSDAGLKWLAGIYPSLLRPPACPQPPRPFETSNLRCPAQKANDPPFYQQLLAAAEEQMAAFANAMRSRH